MARGIGRADHDPVGPLEVIDRRPFAEEFRIGDDGEFGVGTKFPNDPLHLVAGADRYRGLGDDHRETV